MNRRVDYLIKNTSIYLLGSFGSKFLSFFFLPLYTAILSTSQYGQIEIVTTTQSLLLPIVTMGLSEAIFRFVMHSEVDNTNVVSNSFIIALFSYLLAMALASIANYYIKWQYMHWMFLLLACSTIYDFLTNYLKAMQYSKKFVITGLVFTALNLSGNILFLVVLKMEIRGYLLASVISYLIPSTVICVKEKIYKQVRIRYLDVKLAKRMLHYSFPLIFTSLSWWIVTSSDKYMIRYFMSDSEVGVYSIASKIPMILQTIISILQTVWQITTNQMYDEEPQTLENNFIQFTRAFRQVGFISGSFLIILTQPLMMIIARNDFYSGWIYAPFLIVSVVFSFSTGMVSSLYGAYEKNSGVLYSVLLGGGVNIVLNAILIPQIGVMGATISTAVSRLLIALYRLKDTEKLLKFDRGYGSVAINCILITLQCCFLICGKQWRYFAQAIFVALICLYNREVVFRCFGYALKTVKGRKNV